MIAHVSLARTDEQGGRFWQAYDVPCEANTPISQVIGYIYEKVDGTIAYRQCFCKRGLCALCMMIVNGKAVKTCKTPVSEFMRIEPIPGDVIRDMATKFKG